MAKQFYLGEGIHLPRVVIADEAVFPEPAPTGIEALSPTERRMVFMIAKA